MIAPSPSIDDAAHVLRPWMKWLLRGAGVYNLLAGLQMVVFYHESFKAIGIPKPSFILSVQLVGLLVGLFGAAYLMVSFHPLENRNLLLLGLWSKALGSVLSIYHAVLGNVPPVFVLIVFFADIIWLGPFWVILRHIDGVKRQQRGVPQRG